MSAASAVCWPSRAWNCSANSPGVSVPLVGSVPATPVSEPAEPDGSGAASTAARPRGAAALAGAGDAPGHQRDGDDGRAEHEKPGHAAPDRRA
jgi:hypothetical protein